MKKIVTVLGLLLLCTPLLAREPDAKQQLVDRAAIEEVMQKYIWSVDSLDADGYVSVFTEDAVIDSNGVIEKGHDQIRKVVTGLQARQAENRAAGKPPGALYHVISNERISFQARPRRPTSPTGRPCARARTIATSAGGFGRSEDHLVKQKDGKWLIKSRKLVVFTD